MAQQVTIKSSRSYSIQVLRRKLLQPRPGTAEPRHDYEVIFTTRADVTTRSGLSEFAQVSVKGQAVSHTFAIRFTSLIDQIDTRCFVRGARGDLYRVLSVDNVGLRDREIKIHCSDQGLETVEAAR